jgi:hypothetical protein
MSGTSLIKLNNTNFLNILGIFNPLKAISQNKIPSNKIGI